jgi:ABC-type siderophore export system fused ATPase/permease subunit
VISHDDRYFDIADRLIKLDYGKLVGDSPRDNGPGLPEQEIDLTRSMVGA